MRIYCDESGGIGAGVMTFAAVMVESRDVDTLMRRYRDITGLRGELKGSRIDLTERGLLCELIEKHRIISSVCVLTRDQISAAARESRTLDQDAYAQLLHCSVGALLPRTGGCAEIIIDDGRYDPYVLERLRAEMSSRLGGWGDAQLEESHLSPGVQLADVIANSVYNMNMPAMGEGERPQRIRRIMQPLLDRGLLQIHKCRM